MNTVEVVRLAEMELHHKHQGLINHAYGVRSAIEHQYRVCFLIHCCSWKVVSAVS